MKRRRQRFEVDDLVQQAVAGRSLERAFSGQQVVQDDAQRVNVGLVVEPFVLHLLRRHVGRRADSRQVSVFRGQIVGGAEIADLELAIPREQKIARFDIAVDDALLLRVGERQAGLEHECDYAFDRQQRVEIAVPLERAASDVLHDDVALVRVGDRVADRHDVRVNELARARSLVQERRWCRRISIGDHLP